MKTGTISAIAAWAGASVLALSACSPPHPHWRGHQGPLKAITRLDCPQSQGDLKLGSAAADGRSCAYTGSGGAQVTLELIDLKGGDTYQALATITADLRTEVPAAAKGPAPGAGKDRVDIDLPGIHIHASGDDSGHGSAVTSNSTAGASDHVQMHGGSNINLGAGGEGVVVDAGDNGAEVHVSSGHGGDRLAWILTSDQAGPHGFKLVSYDARGPAGGPLVVAVLKSPTNAVEDIRHDIRELLRRNVGGAGG